MRFSFFLGLSLLSLAACAAPTSDESDSSADEIRGGGTEGWFTLRPDLRRCVSPVCGGVHVTLANQAQTTCIDGVKADSCYAAEVDTSALHLPDEVTSQIRFGSSAVVVKAKLQSKKFDNFGKLGVLKVTDAYITPSDDAAAPKAGEKLYFLQQEHVACIVAPCPEIFQETALNAKQMQTGKVDFGGVEIGQAGYDGLVVLGHETKGALVASRVFFKASPALALNGNWGADGATMSIGGGKGHIEFGCGWATIDSFVFSSPTKFTATGTHTAGTGVMPPPGMEPKPQPATFSGTLSGTTLTLKMTTGGNTSSMTFTKDRDVSLIRCL